MDARTADLIRQKKSLTDKKDKEYKEASKDRLNKIINTKFRTVMIGALASIEQNFGFLWGHNEHRRLTPEEQEMKDLFEKTRKEILDKGNAQARNIATELGQYEVEWLRYNLALPVIPDTEQ